jgi:hypothetical protein
MTLVVLDPRTGTCVSVELPKAQRPEARPLDRREPDRCKDDKPARKAA